MANINDIESLFSLIGQSPNGYKEFYHEKNGLHALDKWSYLKNIQLENPNEEGISIFENGPVNSNEGSAASPISSMPNVNKTVNQATTLEKATPTTPKVDFKSAPKIERYTSPVLDSIETVESLTEDIAPQTSTFSNVNDEFVKPEPAPTQAPLEPLTPRVYNPEVATPVAPQSPKVYSTTAIPSVPTFSKNFNTVMNASTSTSFTSSFIKPSTPSIPSTPNLQSTYTPPRFEPSPIANAPNEPEIKPSTSTANPLNSIFSRLEHK